MESGLCHVSCYICVPGLLPTVVRDSFKSICMLHIFYYRLRDSFKSVCAKPNWSLCYWFGFSVLMVLDKKDVEYIGTNVTRYVTVFIDFGQKGKTCQFTIVYYHFPCIVILHW